MLFFQVTEYDGNDDNDDNNDNDDNDQTRTFQVPDHSWPTLSTTKPHFLLFFNHLVIIIIIRMTMKSSHIL